MACHTPRGRLFQDRYRPTPGQGFGGLEQPRETWFRRTLGQGWAGGPVSLPRPRSGSRPPDPITTASGGREPTVPPRTAGSRRPLAGSESLREPLMAASLQLDDIRKAWDSRDPQLIRLLGQLCEQPDPTPDKPIRPGALTFDSFLQTLRTPQLLRT